ncbi:TPA: hypothetical protein NQN30_001862 [Legionella pneumophila]|nr:hypothetical protein [Legionella pneumophila subsp. pneumophila]HCJ1047445.1 hypothetical protein [Legionella pneumophila]
MNDTVQDVVSITLYSKQVNGRPPYTTQLFDERDNIKNIIKGISDAARRENREPPRFVLSVNLVPDWNRANNGYENADYQADLAAFKAQLENVEFKDLISPLENSTPPLEIEYFYRDGNLTDQEKAYMHELHSGGSNADILKTRAIINNKGNRHLQMDSNTKIHSFLELYKATFGDTSNTIATNANYYMWFNVSANNKVVYTPPNSQFTGYLEENYMSLCERNAPTDKHKDSNSIYEKAFNPALAEIGVTKKVVITKEKEPQVYTQKEIYVVRIPACPEELKESPLRITSNVVVAVNMSWNAKPETQLSADEKAANAVIRGFNNLPPVKVGDAICNFACFNYLIKKYTAPQLTDHYIKLQDKLRGGGMEFSEAEMHGFLDVVGAIEDLCRFCTDEELDSKIMIQFYNQVLETNPDIIPNLIVLIPLTVEGDKLSKKLFGCSRKELQQQIEEQGKLSTGERRYPKARLGEDILAKKLQELESGTKVSSTREEARVQPDRPKN